jgi:predicted kinase
MIALWIIGPPGSGKSALVAEHLSPGLHVIDQDAALERAMLGRGMPLDIAQCDPVAFASLRAEVAQRVWAGVPALRAAGTPIAFEVSGDKPDFLREDVALNRAAGYRDYGIALRCPLETCLRRNRQRARIVPDGVIERIWTEFEANLASNVFAEILDSLCVLENDKRRESLRGVCVGLPSGCLRG